MEGILVTGVGGGAGQSVLKALEDSPYKIVGVDAEEFAAGLYAVSSAYRGCYAKDPNFIDRLLEICVYEKCSLIFPGHDVELLPLSTNFNRFTSIGITPVVSCPDVINICDDKLETYLFLKEFGFNVPKTSRFCDVTQPFFPIVLKPQCAGARSRQTYVIHNSQEFDVYLHLIDRNNCIVQEYIDGDEYTCGTLSFNGSCRGVIAMRRILRSGDTYKAFVERNECIEKEVSKIINQLNPFGACNVQLRLRDGIPYVFEINARCSGTTAARAIAGFNEPRMIADFLLHGIEPKYSIQEINIFRYWKEIVTTRERTNQLAITGHLLGDGTIL